MCLFKAKHWLIVFRVVSGLLSHSHIRSLPRPGPPPGPSLPPGTRQQWPRLHHFHHLHNLQTGSRQFSIQSRGIKYKKRFLKTQYFHFHAGADEASWWIKFWMVLTAVFLEEILLYYYILFSYIFLLGKYKSSRNWHWNLKLSSINILDQKKTTFPTITVFSELQI